ncbi:MAG: hypothetical protein K5879_06475 [Lachnospiraceae bacterium]|nr:hypothetical protein [Lachnospiraceae bacterium]
METRNTFHNSTNEIIEESISTTRMTKADLLQKTDEELLQMIAVASGHTGKDFRDYMNCDFSYNVLTSHLKERGYEMGWHKSDRNSSTKPVVIQMKKSDEAMIRQSYMLEKSIADEWKSFNKNVPYKSVTLGYALRRFMSDVQSGRIIFELQL